MPSFDVSVVGELNLDLILYGLPENLELEREHLASNLSATLGSSSAIFSHNLALLGNRVGFSSCVGTDELGQIAVKFLSAGGVDVSRVKQLPGTKSTGLTVILPMNQGRFILTYPGVMFEMSWNDLDLSYICDSRHFHLSSYFLHRGLRSRIPSLFEAAKRAGLTTSLDTNDDPENKWAVDLHELLANVDVLLMNEREACLLAHKKNLAEASTVLSAAVPTFVLKCGAQGAIVWRGGKEYRSAPIIVDLVDSVGAGDSFDAGFIHRFIRGASLEECLNFGNVCGALSVTRSGGTEAFRDSAHRLQFLQNHAPLL